MKQVKEIANQKLGMQLEDLETRIGCLLWVDNVILVELEDTMFQRMLDITCYTSEIKYRNEYDQSKRNVMIKTNRTNRQIQSFKLGNTDLKETDNYKYLCFIQNDKNNMKYHFTVMKAR